MSDTEAVKATRRWRKEVYEARKDLSPAERLAREEEIIRQVREAGVRFRRVVTGVNKKTERSG
jgi:hypothetical protein